MFRSILCLLIGSSFALASEPGSRVSPQFLEKLEAATDVVTQNRIIASRDPSISDQALRDQLLRHTYELVMKGDYLRAERDCELVIRLARAAGNDRDLAAAQINLGYVLRESGDLAGSLAALEEALKYFNAHPEDAHGVISAQQSRGITFLAQSDFAHALDAFHRALSLSQKIGYREGIIPALNSIGEVYRNQGEPERALEFYERARETVGDDNAWNMAFIFNNIGMSYDALGDYERAIENITRARAVAEKANLRPRVENAFAVIGDLELKRGRLDPARDAFRQSLALARELRDVPGEAQAALGLARVAHARGEMQSAIAESAHAADLFRKLGARLELASALTLSGRCLETLKQDEKARAAFEQAIASIEEVRGKVAGGDLEREEFFAREIAPYREMISLLIRRKETEAALTMAERASARVLLEIATSGRADMDAVLSGEETKTQRDLEIRLATAEHDLARLRTATRPDADAIAKAEKTRRTIERERDELETVARASHPELRRAIVPSPLRAMADLTPLLQNGKAALLRYVVTGEDCHLFVVTLPSGTKTPRLLVKSLGKTERDVSRLTSDFRNRLATRSLTWEKPARDLYDLLVRPVEGELAGIESIIIVPDGPLWELPFQALERGPDDPLLARRSVRYAPSLGLLIDAAAATPDVADRRKLLALVNPALGQQDGRLTKVALMNNSWQPLPESEMQVPALEKLYPDGEVLVGAEARESTFKKKASSAGILHFATHGVLDDRAPLYSYLLFSQVGIAPNEDGRLEARELMQMKLRARLAILCGCETARGRVTAGEGMIGLSWGFMVAGCPATIVSQWKVDSASSTPLMVALHHHLQAGKDNATALRLASLELRKDERYRHPFYWAPFVLVGR
jgi:CHAT domain-containing protein/Flp pilus assembly protein TadD